METHHYTLDVEWTGNRGQGTRTMSGYGRDHRISAPGKPAIAGSSDPSFRGDPACWNPEELLLASLSACHKLWYLGLCAGAGVVVETYRDQPRGVMVEEASGAGQFTIVTLRPTVTIARGSDLKLAEALHEQAHAMCFIARSVSFPIHRETTVSVEP
ncbi:OsmC family protein [Sphingomonas jeddahensis]|uniref:OsmC-like protein n=1 Tax=Sphingomonas jeddahensis TaxID=1915074 RepID=A0A1V2EWN1_9SPHN|nr:OsmC family protein [Sphingomonas jeddahensis]ONF97081.1 OsmC-like protein [Sphingomonas jeddahensis]